MNGSEESQRQSVAPRRSRSRSRRSIHSRCRSRSRSRSLHRREQDLERERRHLRMLERELQEQRDSVQRSRRSERRDSRLDSEQREHHSISIEQQGRQRRDDLRKRGPNSGRRSRSCSPLYTSKDFVKLIQSLKNDCTSQSQSSEQSAHSSKKLDYKNVLPEFDPSTKNQRMDIWLRKVNECASVYGWDDKTTIHFSMQKLQGLAKTWYQSLNTILYSWPQWQEKLIKAFPCDQNYGQSLEDMLKRKSRSNEPIENYFYEKLSLINQCEITVKRAVDCIIHGLSDKTAKSSALALRCSEPDELLQFVLSNKESPCQLSPKTKNVREEIHSLNNRPFGTDLYCYNS